MENNEKKTDVLEQLLRPEAKNVAKNLQEKSVEVTRLSKAVGEPVIFKLRGLPYGRVQEMAKHGVDAEPHIVLVGCVSPDFKNASLKEKFGGETPIDRIKNVLLPGEIADLSREIEKLTGYRYTTIADVKKD